MGQTAKRKQIILKGIPASPGIAIGPVRLFRVPVAEPEPQHIPPSKVNSEIQKLHHSLDKARRYVEQSLEKAHVQYGDDLSGIIQIQLALLNDKLFLQEIEEVIQKELFNAAYATYVVFTSKKEKLLKSRSAYLRDRAADVSNLKWLILEILSGSVQPLRLNRPSIVVADDLSPADTVNLHQQKVLGIATNKGGVHSHTVIIARALSVPAVVGLETLTEKVRNGQQMILDGLEGVVVLQPEPDTLAEYERKRKQYLSHEASLMKISAREARTADNKRIFVMANIEFVDEVEHVKKVGADGIGLFRTEGIYIDRHILPTEDEQTKIYTRVAREMYPRPVVIRTIDIGGDKIFPHIFPAQEPNPFLGYRAIRFCLDHRDCFLSQLRAMLRANTLGNVSIMVPMVCSLDEVRRVRDLFEEAKNSLQKDGLPFGEDTLLGIMVEIPSVAAMAAEFAEEVDFFSIGTNDLVQYTLAVDRSNERVAYLYSHFHPAVLRLIENVVQAAQEKQIPVSMCGEMAGDPLAVPLLIAMGLDQFSAAHVMIPEIKNVIRQLRIEDCYALYDEIKQLKTTEEIRLTLRHFFTENVEGVTFQSIVKPKT